MLSSLKCLPLYGKPSSIKKKKKKKKKDKIKNLFIAKSMMDRYFSISIRSLYVIYVFFFFLLGKGVTLSVAKGMIFQIFKETLSKNTV